jgi:DNA uptake protein ComE-like DNA-binding protein
VAPRRAPAKSAVPAEIDLNEATFEELRAFGLSVNQTARVLAQRQQRGGFKAVSDLTAIPGLPHDLLQQLQRSARV